MDAFIGQLHQPQPHLMRITGGTLLGRKLNVPHLPHVRPTTDRARESLFNWLSNRVDFSNCRLTELFAGSGVVSFEMLSRGATKAICVDIQKTCCVAIQKIAHHWGLPVEVVCADALAYMKSASAVDLVFADPPYRLPELYILPHKIMESPLLSQGGWLILEHDRANNFESHPYFQESRRYGEAVFSIFGLSPSSIPSKSTL